MEDSTAFIKTLNDSKKCRRIYMKSKEKKKLTIFIRKTRSQRRF